jgi:GDPmannose 4,6-dehydratase
MGLFNWALSTENLITSLNISYFKGELWMRALITGITGQDGYFLSQFLMHKGYEVYGIVRRRADKKLGNLELLPDNIKKEINILEGDITDSGFINSTLEKLKPDELYHLAAQSFVA